MPICHLQSRQDGPTINEEKKKRNLSGRLDRQPVSVVEQARAKAVDMQQRNPERQPERDTVRDARQDKKALDELFIQVKTYRKSSDFQGLLTFIRRFRF